MNFMPGKYGEKNELRSRDGSEDGEISASLTDECLGRIVELRPAGHSRESDRLTAFEKV